MDQIFEILKDNILSAIVVVGLIVFLFTGITDGENKGIFGIIGSIPTEEVTDTQIHEVPKELEEILQTPMPEITAKNRVYKTMEQVLFSEMFTVVKDDVTYDGTEGTTGGFKLALTGITTKTGDNVLQKMTLEEFEDAEEINFAAIFDEEKDVILFTQSGVFQLHLTCYLNNGAYGRFVVLVPVESFYNVN